MSNLRAVVERPELAVSAPQAPAVIDAEYREVGHSYEGGCTPLAMPRRSVVVPAGLAALAIFAAPVAVYAVLVWSSRP